MRSLLVATCLIAVAGCSSSTGVGSRDTLYGEYQLLYMAAQSAVLDMGGRIVTASETAGMVVGRLEFEGTPVQLDVSLIRSPGPDQPASGGEYVDLKARATVKGVDEPDDNWRQQLLKIERDYIELVGQIAAETRSRGRRSPQGVGGS